MSQDLYYSSTGTVFGRQVLCFAEVEHSTECTVLYSARASCQRNFCRSIPTSNWMIPILYQGSKRCSNLVRVISCKKTGVFRRARCYGHATAERGRNWTTEADSSVGRLHQGMHVVQPWQSASRTLFRWDPFCCGFHVGRWHICFWRRLQTQ